MYATAIKSNAHQWRTPWAMLRLWIVLCMLMNAVQHPRAVRATEDVGRLSPCELESIKNLLTSPEYQLHVSALRNQLKNILRDRQLAIGEEQSLDDYDYPEEDKRSVASLAAQGLLNPSAKRSVATLAKNGQLPTPEPDQDISEEKRYVGALARSGGMMSYGKRNIGTLARDYQLPHNGKRNMATLARLGLLNPQHEPKRNVAAVARHNSHNRIASAEKRNLGALKGSPVHGTQQKREDEELLWANNGGNGGEIDYVDMLPNYWMYPSYADLDWNDYARAQKRFLDTSKDSELFGIENAIPMAANQEQLPNMEAIQQKNQYLEPNQQKRHIGAVYRSGFLPSYRALRSTTGNGGGHFSRSLRARQFAEYYPQLERLRQPTAAVCKRCFLPNRPVVNWGATGIRGRFPKYLAEERTSSSILTNSLPSERHPIAYATSAHSWGTPPRITALHRRSYRRNDDSFDSYEQ